MGRGRNDAEYCVECGSKPPEPGNILCKQCQEEYNRTHREEMIELRGKREGETND